MTHDKTTVNCVLRGFERHSALKLVYHLAQNGAEEEIYQEAARILQRAADDKAAGRDPGDRVAYVNGQYILVDSTGDPRG